jgi:hypothetical protein
MKQLAPKLLTDVFVQFAICPALALFILGPMGDWLFSETGVAFFPPDWHDEIVALRLPVLVQVLLAFYFAVFIPTCITPCQSKRASLVAEVERENLKKMLQKSKTHSASAVLPSQSDEKDYGSSMAAEIGAGEKDSDGLLGAKIDSSMSLC